MKIYEDSSELPAFEGNLTVKNWEHPELYETTFPHDSLPRLSFTQEPVPVKPCQDTLIHDLSLTEGGLWSRLDDETLGFYLDAMRRLSGSRGVLRCLEVPADDINRLNSLLEKNYQFPEMILKVDRDVKAASMPVSQLVADFAGSDFYLQGVLHSSRQDEFKAIQSFVNNCFDADKVPVIRLVDVSRGVGEPYLFALVEKLLKMTQSSDLPIRIRLADSLGLFHPHPQVSFPRGLPRLLHHLVQDQGYPGEWLVVEPANDSSMAQALVQATWLYGVDAVGATLGGRGPRAGLASIEGALASLLSLRQDAPKINLCQLREIEDNLVSKGVVDTLPSQAPYLGQAVYSPRGTVFSGADNLINPYDPSLVWGTAMGKSLSASSSRQDVVDWLRERLGPGAIISPEHPGVVKMTEWLNVSSLDHIDEKDLVRQARRYLPGFFVMEGEG